ncbi:MAG: hypothetical protein AB7S75_06795 [Desulfococcaceae bacterium]
MIRICVLMLSLFFSCLAVSGCGMGKTVKKPQVNAEARKIAAAYGIGNFSRIEAIRYTCNLHIRNRHIQRSWIWEPDKNWVTYKGNSPGGEQTEFAYSRSEKDRAVFDDRVDKWFASDQNWLLFPFHLEWDGAEIVSDGSHPLPIPPGDARRLTVRYPPESGYTAGDIYELYYGPDYVIRQWVYRKRGSEKPTRITTWEEHAKAGPILVSLTRNDDEGRFRLWFSGVAVRLRGSTVWLPALIY